MKRSGQLPWAMSAEQWELFKKDPESFRERPSGNTAQCSGCGATSPREDLIFFDAVTRYCASCLEVL
jgi:hypothetical protein